MAVVTPQYHPHGLLLDSDPQIPVPSENRTRASDSADSNFDSNMVIILAALLCSLICALGLNSIIRCVLRCSHRFVFETPHQTAVRLAATGLKKQALNKIPVAVYGSKLNIPATDCPICLGEFVEGEKVRILPICNHGFHVNCIDTWLLSRSSCPTCRQPLCDRRPSSGVEEAADVGIRPPRGGTSSEEPGFVVTIHEVS